MDLEEHTIETLPNRCESCGTALTDAEKARILQGEQSGPVLCNSCAAEQVPLEEEAEGEL